MDSTHLSPDQLGRSGETLQRMANAGRAESEQNDEVMQALQVHQIELEMQNQALQETQRELESALQRYTDLYDRSPVGYLTLTPAGRIIGANFTAAEWLQRDRADLVGGFINWFFDAFDAGRFAAHLERCLEAGAATLHDVTLRLHQGLQLTVQLSSWREAAGLDSAPIIHTAITNITRLKQAQEILGDMARERHVLTSALGQDLREPLSTISEFGRVLLQEHTTNLSPEARSLIERLQFAAARIDGTLQDLLDYCCLGGTEAALDPLSLDEVAQQLIVELRAMIQQRGAEVVIDRPLPCVRGSRMILGQVLAHLLLYSLKSVPPGAVPRVQISARETDQHVAMVLSATATAGGRGPALNVEQFRRFESHPIESRGGASGMALALLSRAIGRMKGKISVEADATKVAAFQLQLAKV